MPSLQDRERAFAEGPTKTEPFDVWPGDPDRMPPFPFPRLYLEDDIEGWVLIRRIPVVRTPGVMSLFTTQIIPGHGYSILEFSDFNITFGEYIRREVN